MVHDFEQFPELTNSQLDFYYFESPHKQIIEDFQATVIKVHDGDTVTLKVDFRDFEFPLRFLNTNAPELKDPGGEESQEWLEEKILNEEVTILIDPKQRVGKFGRLLGEVFHRGMNINDESIRMGQSTTFEGRRESELPNLNKELNITKWF